MSGDEQIIAMQWAKEQLLASTDVTDIVDTRVYYDKMPKDALYPSIVIQVQDADDLRGVGSVRIWTDTLLVVKAIAQCADDTVLAPVVRAIDGALNVPTGGTVVSPAGQVTASVRERPFKLIEVDQGVEFRHLGGIFRIHAQST